MAVKARLKNLGKTAVKDATTVGITLGGLLASRKFLDFQTIFKNQPEDSFMRKNEGPIKLIGGVLAIGMIKNPMIKALAIGMALDGGVMTIRNMTRDKDTGESFFPAISGNGKMLFDPKSNVYYQQDSQGQWKQVQVSGQPSDPLYSIAGKFGPQFMGNEGSRGNNFYSVGNLPLYSEGMEAGVAGMSEKMFQNSYYKEV